MKRFTTTLLLAFALSANASAAMLQFVPGTIPDGENPLTVVGDGVFEISDVANPAPNDFQFNAVTPFDVQVVADGGATTVNYTLARIATANDRLNMIFSNPAYSNLVLGIDVPGLVKGDAIPGGTIEDANGIVNWNAPGLYADAGGMFTLAGKLEGTKILEAVPEPSSLALVFTGLLGLAHFIRRR